MPTLELIAVWTLWLSLGVVVYAYVGYPVVLRLLSALRKSSPVPENPAPDDWPMVSLIIAAYKEEKIIVSRLINATLLDYPADKLEIIVGVDGSEDCTSDLVREFADSRVKCLQYPIRRGKASVLNDTVPQARGEIIVFSDANTFTQPPSIKLLVRHFQRATVGSVCGKLELVDSTTGQNVDGVYWKYENFLKAHEGRIGGLLGVNGAIYALRKSLWQPIPANTIVDDFLIGMRVHLAGQELLYEPRAIATEETPETIGQEFQRRSRIGAGGFQSLAWLWPLLSPARGSIAFTFWSHKVIRWVCPWFMGLAVIANISLVADPFYAGLLGFQAAFYGLALLGGISLTSRRLPRLLRLPAMFVGMNAALTVGLWRYLKGIRSGTWKRTERVQTTEVVSR